MLYDPTFSERGALLPVARAPRAASELDFAAPMLIHAPHTLPMFKEDGPGPMRKRGREPEKRVRVLLVSGGGYGCLCCLCSRRMGQGRCASGGASPRSG